VAVLGQQKFGTEVAVAFRVGLPARRIPAGLQDGVQRLGDRLAQALVKVVIEWAEIPVEEVREPPGRRPDVVHLGDFPIPHPLAPDIGLAEQRPDEAVAVILRIWPGISPR
jgi:hypothetical protein